jgi:acetyl-CoA carboxylase carboxyltransferase component
MRISVTSDTTDEEAEAIATAVSNYLGRPVEIVHDGTDEPLTSVGESWSDEGAVITDREERIREQIAEIMTGGPERGHEKIEQLGKLFVRERLDLFFDDIDYENGTFARYDADENLAADGIVTGSGRINGRQVYFVANDYTVKAGTSSTMTIEKQLRIQERADEMGAPILYLVDSAGARITDQSGFFADRYRGGKMFYNQCLSSGRVPQIGVLYGPSVAGAAYTPMFCDYLFMVEGMSSMAIASPRMVEMVTGEEVEMENLGGPRVHATESGSADLTVTNEEEAVARVKDLLTYLPQDFTEKPPRSTTERPQFNPHGLDSVIPENPNKAFDIHDVIDRLIDSESWFELKPEFAKELVTGFARIDGRPVGIVANQSSHKGGAIYPDSAEKAADFIWKCDAFNTPLVYLVDTPGFMVGQQVEQDGILQRGRKFIYATSSVTVPKFCVVVRKAYGAGIYAMSGPAFGTDATLALPSGEIAVMGPKAAVNAVYANQLADIDDPDERQAFVEQKREEYREDIDMKKLASEMIVDELTPASELRELLTGYLHATEDKDATPPERKHGTILF